MLMSSLQYSQHPICILEALFIVMPTKRLLRSYALAPPRYLILALNSPQPQQEPQNVLIEEAAEEDADATLEYAL